MEMEKRGDGKIGIWKIIIVDFYSKGVFKTTEDK